MFINKINLSAKLKIREDIEAVIYYFIPTIQSVFWKYNSILSFFVLRSTSTICS